MHDDVISHTLLASVNLKFHPSAKQRPKSAFFFSSSIHRARDHARRTHSLDFSFLPRSTKLPE